MKSLVVFVALSVAILSAYGSPQGRGRINATGISPYISISRQVFYLENWIVGVRAGGSVRFYEQRGQAPWRRLNTDLTNLGAPDETFYLGNGAIGIRRGSRTVQFHRRIGAANWAHIPSLQFVSRKPIDELFAIDSNSIAVRTKDSLRVYKKLGASPWKQIDSSKLPTREAIDRIIYAGQMTIGIKTGNIVRFYRQRGTAPWEYLNDLDFILPEATDEIFYTTDFVVGVRMKTKVQFYQKRGQAPWIKTSIPILSLRDSTGSFSFMQKYLGPAPGGIDARYAWTVQGGKGANVSIVDIEDHVDIDHEDFKAPFWISSRKVYQKIEEFGAHGTAVIGIMSAQHNGYGIDGICPEADYGLSEVTVPDSNNAEDDPTDHAGKIAIAAAIDTATAHLKVGDIILIEAFFPNPTKVVPSLPEGCQTFASGAVPVEYDSLCFDAILRASKKCIIVVEAAANGGISLDDTLYHGIFNRRIRDSKAILVAADGGGDALPACWTNYGSRIDFLHGDTIL